MYLCWCALLSSAFCEGVPSIVALLLSSLSDVASHLSFSSILCVCVCVSMCLYPCVCASAYVCLYVCIRVFLHLSTCVYVSCAVGTHTWEKFLVPAHVRQLVEGNSFSLLNQTGFSYNPLMGRWTLSNNMSVNYAMTFRKHKN
jgi:hypothetical protein